MLFNPWSLGLILLSSLTVFLVGVACRTAVRVIGAWNPAADSQQQIELESEIWLSSTLVQYGLAFQIISLFLYVLAADHFSGIISGAMCATGSLLANQYGVPLLVVKIAGLFLYGWWIVLHQLDISSEVYPLVRVKYIFLLALLPLLVADTVLLFLYLAALQPDIITSCCAVIFDSGQGGAMQNLLGNGEGREGVLFYYGFAVLLVMAGVWAWRHSGKGWFSVYGVGMGLFFFLALDTIITVLSSYIYAMPFHKCPFCMLKVEYGGIGFFIYLPLFIAVFCGITPMVIQVFCKDRESLAATITILQKKMVGFSVAALLIYLAVSSSHYLLYMVLGGEG